jgi:hypothetical protein
MKTKDRWGKSEGEPGMFLKIKELSVKSGNVFENRQLNVFSPEINLAPSAFTGLPCCVRVNIVVYNA